MLYKFFLIFFFVFVIPLGGFSQEAKKFDTYAGIDYASYLQGSHSSPLWNDFVKEGFEALDRKDLTTAIDFLRKAANMGCLSPLVYFKLALGFEALGSYYTAVQYYELAQEKFKTSHQDHRYAKDFNANYGRALYMMGQLDKAIAYLENDALTQNQPWVLKILTHHYLSQQTPHKAGVFAEKLLHIPNNGLNAQEVFDLNLQVARIYAQRGDSSNAKKFYQQVLAIDPKNAEANQYVRSLQTKPRAIPTLNKNTESVDKIFELLENH